MDAAQSAHLARVRHLREAFASANEQLVGRLRAASDEQAHRQAGAAWSAAQVGWHVAAVNTRFAALIAGDVPAVKPLPEDFAERPWPEIAAGLPEKLTASPAAMPPEKVTRQDAIALLEASAVKMARAFDTLTPERGARTGVSNPLVGTISLYQVGEWAASHVRRHDAQVERALDAATLPL
ncbi:MAG TPA: DinB family protein [Vicinamibacterales bacterium]|nr:DinB family protein [Vicinamibacterales bacterium]